MQWPSLSVILSEVFLGYIVYSIYTLSQLFVSPVCEDGNPCLESYLIERPRLDLYMYSSVRRNPANRDADLVHSAQSFDYYRTQTMWASLHSRISLRFPFSYFSLANSVNSLQPCPLPLFTYMYSLLTRFFHLSSLWSGTPLQRENDLIYYVNPSLIYTFIHNNPRETFALANM